MVSLAVDVDSDNRGGNGDNGGGAGGGKGEAVDFNSSYCPRDIRIEGDDMFIFSGNGGNTLFWNWPDTLPTGS